MTNRQLLIRAFEVCGCTQIQLRSTKYVAFDGGPLGLGRHYLIGRSGALRIKHANEAVDRSISLTGGRWHRSLLLIGSRSYSTADQARTDLNREWGKQVEGKRFARVGREK